MENFIVSARKYRPTTFDSVVGQEYVTKTLKNAIKINHLAQAYLFCGPRGVGKTTCARIFAKTINCQNITEDGEACNACESCLSFNELRSYNIHELDAASNNSVEDIRSLTDQVRIPPQIGKFSIYIIDEVHMLSASAFNAFLKTLEEPPKHAIFILATTEKQKIIPTILSRCQIFDFSRIKVHEIVDYLMYVSQQEGVNAEPDALNIIAQKADGAMRDALSIFDQLVSFSGKNITYKDVLENLNVLDYAYYFKVTNACLENNVSECLMIFNDILENGFDGHHFITGLSSHFRDLLVCKDQVTLQLLEVGGSMKDKYRDQSVKCTSYFLYKALEVCSNTDIYYKGSNNQRLHIELALVKLCRILISEEPLEKKEIPQKKTDTEFKEKPDTASDSSPDPESKTEPDIPEIREEDNKDFATVNESTQKKFTPTTTSIKDAIKSAVKKEKKPEGNEEPAKVADNGSGYENIAANGFTQDALLEKWQNYAQKIKNDKPRLFTTLKSQLPALKNDYNIEVEMNNGAQMDQFDKELKLDLTNYLRTELNNHKINIFTYLIKEEKTKNNLYTDEDKFKHLTKKNPNLGELKQKFNLDFE
ncbi:Holliday junction ATP-dependent DNA helicase RuvB [subsurface metagenome]|nr:DNA polymerase III subunit gamma/tau [Bacteroidota bacterium]